MTEIKATRLWVKGNKVVWNNLDAVGAVWKSRHGKVATVVQDQEDFGGSPVLVDFGNDDVCSVKPESLTAYVEEAKPQTIHDQARERFELAMTYAEDGALATAASILEEIAHAYRTRINEMTLPGAH